MPENFDLNNPLVLVGLALLLALGMLRLLQSRKQHAENMNGDNPQTHLLQRLVVVSESQERLSREHNEVMATEHAKTRKTIGDLAEAIREHDGNCAERWDKARKAIRESGAEG